jgi:hypothetical protein
MFAGRFKEGALMMYRILFAAALTVGLTGAADAQILAEWTFEDSGPDLIVNNSATSPDALAEGGVFQATSIARGVHARAETDWSSPAGNGSVESFNANEWSVGDYWEFTTSTLGYSEIEVSWDQTRSGTGPDTFDLMWSTDGVTFNLLVDNYIVQLNQNPPGFWSATGDRHAFYTHGPHALPAAAENQATLYIRLVNQLAPGGLSGTNRIDNVLIVSIPEPGTLGLLALGGLALLRRRIR